MSSESMNTLPADGMGEAITTPNLLKVTEQYQATARKYSRTEVFANGFNDGLKENFISYMGDATRRLNEQFVDTEKQELTQEEFEALPAYRPGMRYWPGMTYESASIQAESIARMESVAMMRERSNSFLIPYLAGGLTSGFLAPENYTPLGLPVKGSTWWYNAARMAGANATIEMALTPLTAAAWETRGLDYEAEDMAKNVVFAAAAGGLISAGISGIGAGYNRLKGTVDPVSVMGHNIEAPLLKDIIDPTTRPKDFKMDTTLEKLLQQRYLEGTETPGTHIKNLNPLQDTDTKFIGTDGNISTDPKLVNTKEYATVTNKKNTLTGGRDIEVGGSNEATVKILNSLKQYLDFRDQITIKAGKREPVTIAATQVDDHIAKELKFINKNSPAVNLQEAKNIDMRAKNLRKMYVKLLQEKRASLKARIDRSPSSNDKEIDLIDDLIGKIKKGKEFDNPLTMANLWEQGRRRGLMNETFVGLVPVTRTADLDNTIGLTTRDRPVGYEFEANLYGDVNGFDPINGIGKIYRVEDKKGKRVRTLLPKEDAVKVFKELQDYYKITEMKNKGNVNLEENLQKNLSDSFGRKSVIIKGEKIQVDETLDNNAKDIAIKINQVINTLRDAYDINIRDLNLEYNPRTGQLTDLGPIKNANATEKARLDEIKKILLDDVEKNIKQKIDDEGINAMSAFKKCLDAKDLT